MVYDFFLSFTFVMYVFLLVDLNVVIGICYATSGSAAGKFTPEDGGVLQLKDRDDIKLVIPPWALKKTEDMSLKLLEEPVNSTSISFSPRVECSPDGLTFNVSIISRICDLKSIRCLSSSYISVTENGPVNYQITNDKIFKLTFHSTMTYPRHPHQVCMKWLMIGTIA